jgi:nitrite reductase/ring-hydroxylating ferredoxin subunit
MLTREDNERLTRVGPGTPMGELLRRYWLPAAFSRQLAVRDGAPLRTRLLGEDLVLFRASDGAIGLVDERCPHRTASLFYGRNEENGLRCVYHGIKFDVAGNCVDVPCLPPGTPQAQIDALKRQLRLKSYPCLQRGGLIWTYMGPAGQEPAFPDLEWVALPPEQRFDTRHIQECNWLQGVEGGYDATHLSFLHGGAAPTYATPNRFIVPSHYEEVATDYGYVFGTGRDLDAQSIEWNLNVFLMPFHKMISSLPYAAHMWMPIDDENTMLYSINFNPERPFTAADLARETSWNGIHTENVPGTERTAQNRGNDYLIDRELQASGKSYTGMRGFGIQDCAIQESMGRIADRTRENLLVTDLAIAKIRRFLLDTLDGMAAGKPLPGRDPQSFRVRSVPRFELPRNADVARRIRDAVRLETQLAAE